MAPLKSWLSIPPSSPFSLHNLPFGITSHSAARTPHPAIAIGNHALDLQIFTAASGFRHCSPLQAFSHVFSATTLNPFAALGRPLHSITRKYIESVLLADGPFPDILERDLELQKQCLIPLEQVTMHLPMAIGDYTDFYAGLYHARNCGAIFRGPLNALQPNYRHMPVAYHGRASSIVVSGTSVTRPRGQFLQDPSAQAKIPAFAPTRRLDFELELGCFLCKPSELGSSILVQEAKDHLFGVVLLNDWSARDFQAWEAAPLGPFTSKNFCTSISPWVVLMEALDPFGCGGIEEEKEEVFEHLKEADSKNVFDMRLEVSLLPAVADRPVTLTSTNGKHLLWSFSQMLAHHTAGGCNVNVGDLLGSGTISGLGDGTYGCLLESSMGKTTLVGNVERPFLEDGDTVTFRGVCGEEGALVGFGECIGKIMPAKT